MTFSLSITICLGQRPIVHVGDFAHVQAATDYALQTWPGAALVTVKPVKVINLCKEAL